DYIKRMESIDNIEILPRLTEEELADEMSGATVLLAPFQYEGFGMVIIESFSSGTPVVGLNHGNVGQLLSKPPLGVRLNQLDVNEWKDSIKTIRTTTDEDVLRNEARRYSWDRIARQYDSVYERNAK
ncbi:glycosyltransferase, partial [Halorubrum sp. Atlit-26R]|uniref:glycosyltransferase n=1 Tax=Halorubrum sp. Atlit-26R TaxID=2282128 RepID=UPI000F12137B